MAELITEETMVERAKALLPTIAARTEQAAELRRIPDETMKDLHDAGLFLATVPKRFGGYELNPRVLYDIQLELGRVCASTAWVFGVLSVHTWQLALFEEEAQQEVWGAGGPRTLISSSYMPVGKVEKVEGGYTLSGRWSFSSGCDHCDWVMLGSFVPSEEGAPPDMRTFLLPRADYEIIDTWYVTGLRASGSKDIVVTDAFIPEHRTHKFSDGFRAKSPGNSLNESPYYRYPFGQIHTRCVSTPALGAARGALEAYNEAMRSKVSQATGGRAADNLRNAEVAADAAATIDREELTLRRNFDEMLDFIRRGEPIPMERRAQFRHDAARAVTAAVQVIDNLFETFGSRAVFTDNALNRHFQDAHAIRAHHANQVDKPAANFGGMQIGKRNTDFFI